MKTVTKSSIFVTLFGHIFLLFREKAVLLTLKSNEEIEMKKLPILFLLLLAIATLPRCSSPSENTLLVAADSLLLKNELDSAGQILSVMRNSLTSEQERAYWQLLNGIFLYKTKKDDIKDSIFDFPIRHYQENDTKRKLALAQIYKGSVQLREKEYAKAAVTLKESEKTANESADEEAIMRIHIILGVLNGETGITWRHWIMQGNH